MRSISTVSIFRYEEPRSLKEIDKELAAVDGGFSKMLQEVTE